MPWAPEPDAPRLALAGGGTGGHMVPGLHLLAHAAGSGLAPHVLWLGAGRSVEERVLRAASPAIRARLERVVLPLEPPGGGAPSRARLLGATPASFLRARRALACHGARVCLGLGGFTVLPAALAARSLGVPLVLLEVNARAGLATRRLARLATHVVHAWPASVPPGARGARHVVLGPPLAPAFLAPSATAAERADARAALGLDPARPLLVVLGGSQGAGGLNRFVAQHLAALQAHGVQVLHQLGPGRLPEGGAARAGYLPREFVDDVRGALDAADVVLTRGGASTLAEIAARGVPAVVVPYPHHADRHQEWNARALGDGAEVVAEEALDLGLARRLAELCAPASAGERARRGALLRAAVPADAAERLLALLLTIAGRLPA